MSTNRRWKNLLLSLFAVAIVLLLSTAVVACPTCKNGLAENDPHHQSLVSGYYYSILFMMSMPFLLLGSIGGYFYLEVRKARKGVMTNDEIPNDEVG